MNVDRSEISRTVKNTIFGKIHKDYESKSIEEIAEYYGLDLSQPPKLGYKIAKQGDEKNVRKS